jgi:phasin family protein
MKAKAPAAEFLAANEASMDAIHALAAEGLEHARRVAELNLATARAATADSARQVQAMLGADDLSALHKLQSEGLEPQIALAVAYVRDVSEIATDAHQQFIEITQAWIGHLKTRMDSAVREASSSASAGSEALFAALESASGVASELYEKVSESSVQALAAPADAEIEGESAHKSARRSARAARTTATGSEAGEAVISDGEN